MDGLGSPFPLPSRGTIGGVVLLSALFLLSSSRKSKGVFLEVTSTSLRGSVLVFGSGFWGCFGGPGRSCCFVRGVLLVESQVIPSSTGIVVSVPS